MLTAVMKKVVVDEDGRCIHEQLEGECGWCWPRTGAVDLHAPGGGGGGVSAWEQEIVEVVHFEGTSYGLVPSDGTVYVFGAGQAVHHRAECWYGSDTPDHEVVRVPDPQRDLSRRLTAIPFSARALREALAREAGLINARGGPAWYTCVDCTLRPRAT